MPTRRRRRQLLRGVVGTLGVAALAGIGSFLLWQIRRTHTPLFTYRYRNQVSGLAEKENVLAINTVDWSPDGKRILVAQGAAPPQSWDAFTGEKRQTYQPAEANAAIWSPDGQSIALSQRTWTERPFLSVINATTGRQKSQLTRETSQMHGLARFAWAPNSPYLALADADSLVIKLWNPVSGAFGQTYTLPLSASQGSALLQDVVWSPNGEYLAVTVPEPGIAPDGRRMQGSRSNPPGWSGVYIWHVQKGDLFFHYPAQIPFNTNGSPLLSWSPKSEKFAFANKATVQIIDLALQKPVLTYLGHPLEPTSVAWSPEGTYIASSTYDWTVQVWEAATGMLHFLYQGHRGVVTDVAWSPDGKYIASSSVDGTAQVWQPQ